MAKKQNSGRITLANIVAILGIVLLLLSTYIGQSYKSGGELEMDIMISVGITAFVALLLWFLIKAKGAENELDKWRIIEYAALAVYIFLAIPLTAWGGIVHFFVVNDNKDNIKQYAVKDLAKIDSFIALYKDFESEAITITGTGLQNATGRNQIISTSLSTFMENNRISRSRDGAESFEGLQRDELLGTAFNNFEEVVGARKNDILAAVNRWSVLQIPFVPKRIYDLAKDVGEELTNKSKEATLPVIKYVNGEYTITEYNQLRDFIIVGDSSSYEKDKTFELKKNLKETAGFSITAIIVVLIIHLLILFNYIVAYRTNVLRNNKYDGEYDGQTL